MSKAGRAERGEKTKAKNLFSSSSSDEDELGHELTTAATQMRAKNPHVEASQNQLLRSNRIDATKLFTDSSSDEDNEQEKDEKEKAPVESQTAAQSNKKKKSQSQTHAGKAVDGDGIRINQTYATSYEQLKRKQELQRLAEKYGDRLASMKSKKGHRDSDSEAPDEEEDDEDEDDNGLLLTAENELAFAKALLAIRRANLQANPAASATIASPDGKAAASGKELLQETFFPPVEEQIRRNNEVMLARLEARKQRQVAKFTLADEYRRALHHTAAGGSAHDENNENGDPNSTTAASDASGSGLRKLKPQTAEEKALRESFLQSVAESTENFVVHKKVAPAEHHSLSSEVDTDPEVALRQTRNHLLAEAFELAGVKEEEGEDHDDATSSTTPSEANHANNNKEEIEKEKNSHKTTASRRAKPAYSKKQVQDERFLRDFFMFELWRPEHAAEGKKEEEGEETSRGHGAVLAELAQAEEDEAFYRDAEVWEREYQTERYRHEEEGGAYVETFPRAIGAAAEGLLRRPKESRKEARQRRQERLAAAKAQRTEDLKRLKHLKRLEIEERRALIAAVAGITTEPADPSADTHATAGDVSEKPKGSKGDGMSQLRAVWTEEALNAPFDPVEFDRQMAQLFNEDYYNETNLTDEVAYLDAELDNVSLGELNEPIKEKKEEEKEEGTTAEKMKKQQPLKQSMRDNLEALLQEPELFHASSLEAARAIVCQEDNKNATHSPEEIATEVDPLLRELGGGLGTEFLYPTTSPAPPPTALAAPSNEGLLEQLRTELAAKEAEYDALHEDSESGLRFRYREVPAEDFTLSVEEILCRDDRQLNMLAPMNCYAAYLDRHANARDRRRVEQRRRRGFREIAPERASRHYGDLRRTIVLDPNLPEAEGRRLAEELHKRLHMEEEQKEQKPFKQHRVEEKGGKPEIHAVSGQQSRSNTGGGLKRSPFASSSRGQGQGWGRGRVRASPHGPFT